MIRAALTSLVVALCLSVGVSADVKKYGQPLTLKETTKIADIYANPEKFKDKRVRVEGPILDVCTDMGCWVLIGSGKDGESIRFKVEDGVIEFPPSVKGSKAVAEGVITVTMQSVEAQIAQGQELAKDSKTTFDPKSIKGPKLSITMKGEGAEIQSS